MELEEKTLDGHWATDNNSGVDFFIINDAVFSKLCILGDEVEPCFEGSAVTSPEVSKNFSITREFEQTLFTMMNELKDALSSKGGLDMPEEFTEQTETAEENATAEAEVVEDNFTDNSAAEESIETGSGEFEEKDDDKDDSNDSNLDFSESATEENEEPSSEYSLEEEFAALKEEAQALRAECEELRAFKLKIEDEQKDALINSYYMLSDEDKREIMENKSSFTLDEIKSKLAVIYVEKNVDFSTLDGQPEKDHEVVEEDDPITTFSLDDEPAGFVSPLQEALRRTVLE